MVRNQLPAQVVKANSLINEKYVYDVSPRFQENLKVSPRKIEKKVARRGRRTALERVKETVISRKGRVYGRESRSNRIKSNSGSVEHSMERSVSLVQHSEFLFAAVGNPEPMRSKQRDAN